MLDAFLGHCDYSTGNANMILGSCRIGAIVGNTRTGPEMRKLELGELFGDEPSVQPQANEIKEVDSDGDQDNAQRCFVY